MLLSPTLPQGTLALHLGSSSPATSLPRGQLSSLFVLNSLLVMEWTRASFSHKPQVHTAVPSPG